MDKRDLAIVLKLQDEASAELKRVMAQMDAAEGSTRKWGATFKTVGASIVAALGAVAIAGFSAFKDFQKFNAEIERAGAFVSASAEEMKLFREAAIDAARGTQFSFEQTAVALQNFVGGEIDAATAAKELGSIVDLALVAKINDLQQAVNLGSLALTVFKKDGMEMADVIDIMATVAADVTTQTDQWSSAIVQSAGAAKAAGFSYKELNVLFAQMVRGGADVNLMWAAFNSAMNRIQAPTKQSIEALEGVGLSTTGLAAALRDGPIPLLQYLRQGFEKANESGQGFAFLTHTLGAQAAPEFALALGLTNEELEETAGYFDDIGGKGAEMTQRLRDAMPATQVLGQAFNELKLAIGGALDQGTPLADMLRQVAEGFRVVAGWVNNYETNMTNLKARIQDILLDLDANTGLVTLLTEAWQNLVFWFDERLKPALMDLWTTLEKYRPMLEALGQVFGFMLVVAIGALIQILGGLAIALVEAFTWIVKIADYIATTFLEAWNSAVEGLSDAIVWVMDLVDAFKEAYNWVTRLASAMAGIGGKVLQSIIPGRADGGPVSGGSPYIVGERGPELFVPNTNGSIVPNGAMAGVGGGVTVIVNGDVSGMELVDKVTRALADNLKRRISFA